MRKNDYVEYDVLQAMTLDEERFKALTQIEDVNQAPRQVFQKGFVKFIGMESIPVSNDNQVVLMNKTIAYVEDELTGLVVDISPVHLRYLK